MIIIVIPISPYCAMACLSSHKFDNILYKLEGVQWLCTNDTRFTPWQVRPSPWTYPKLYISSSHRILIISTRFSQGGWGILYQKDEGACHKFWKESLRGTKILLCGYGLNFFTQEVPSLKQHIISCIFFCSVPCKILQKLPLRSFWG